MRVIHTLVAFALLSCSGIQSQANAADVCKGYGPQTPRDISSKRGSNVRAFVIAPSPENMNLCNIHFHTQAEHKGPGYSISAGAGEHGGFRCSGTGKLTKAELDDPTGGNGACHNVKPGDTVEVHWVYTSCDTQPGKGLDACVTEQCANPQLRVEAQVFLVVNDARAIDFRLFDYNGNSTNALHQPKALPTRTGTPVVFRGSTTGPEYTEEKCSPLQVTWSVRPACAKVSEASLNAWCEHNVFGEDQAHGVRQQTYSRQSGASRPLACAGSRGGLNDV